MAAEARPSCGARTPGTRGKEAPNCVVRCDTPAAASRPGVRQACLHLEMALHLAARPRGKSHLRAKLPELDNAVPAYLAPGSRAAVPQSLTPWASRCKARASAHYKA